MLDLDAETLRKIIVVRVAELTQNNKGTLHPDEAQRVTLPVGYNANGIADLVALKEELSAALWAERYAAIADRKPG
jgi:hypothetical protein